MLTPKTSPQEFTARRTFIDLPAMRLLAILGGALGLFACQGDLGPFGGKNKSNGDDGASSPNTGVGSSGDCVPRCDGRDCGDDGCGSVCGSCAEGVACNPQAGTCALLCGNGVLDANETCDPPGSCALSCTDDGDACTSEALVGTAESCSTACVTSPVTACSSGDGCCPSGCDAVTDSDCDPVCGNGVSEPGETCGDGGPACPVACDDGDLCTEDVLVGATETCDAACEFTVIDPCSLDQARGVTVGDISIDQGVRIALRQGGQEISAENRSGDLIVERPALVRADWVLGSADFVERDIRAVLTLAYLDGTTDSVETVTTTGERPEYTYDDDRDAYFFLLGKEQVQKGMSISVELFEVDESYRMQPPPTVPARFPGEAETFFDLGVNTEPSHLEVVLVPIYHNLGANCPAAPNLYSMTDRAGTPIPEHEYYRQRLVAMNPVSDATVIVHDVVNFSGSAESSGDIFTLLRQVRQEDDAEDWQFYYGVIEPCDDGPSFSGVASVPSHGDDGLPDMNDASRRTGWGDYRENGRHAGTFVHEVGHEQGRRHVICGGASGPDPDYPNGTGEIEAWGWDVYSGSFHPPDDKDYMSYCGPSWISEYAWNLMEPWIAEVSRWPSLQLFETSAVTPMIYATIQPGKASQWWTGSVKRKPQLDTSNHRLDFYAGATLVGSAVAEYEDVHKQPGAYFLSARLPAEWSRVTELVHSDGTSAELISKADVVKIK